MAPWEAWLIANEPTLRLGAFAGLLFVFSLAEAIAPKRRRNRPRGLRWLSHGLLTLANTLALRVLVPLLAVGTALWAAENQFGLLHQFALPTIIEWIAVLLLLDAAIYFQHRISHIVPLFWRVHRLHHSDVDIDATTALRFHPIEIVISMFYKMGVVAALGAPTGAIIMFEITLNGIALFNHANWAFPTKLDKILRLLIVTPDMHRVHHSTDPQETNSNYGFFLSVWDHLFQSYRAQPKLGHAGMKIGLTEFGEDVGKRGLFYLLAIPFFNTPPSPDKDT